MSDRRSQFGQKETFDNLGKVADNWTNYERGVQMTTEIVVHRSKWSVIKVIIGGAAVAAMLILVAFVIPLPPVFRVSAWMFGTILGLMSCTLVLNLTSELPACIIRDEGILVRPFGISRQLSLIPWTTVRNAVLVDLAPASAPIGHKGAFGNPAIRLTLAERFFLSRNYLLLVGGANLTPDEIYSCILARKAGHS
ncbi:hypothetical protein [Cupriavidus sp. TMH.W2]|uniref:hypothetical protein n=1 Tax=Cupriavidus sp. TMH.W2 TaxID=3434465 RepID=UPI003D773C42